MEDNLPALGIYDMIQAKDGRLWIGTEGGGLCSFDGVHFQTYDLTGGMSDETIRCVYQDRDGQIWCGTQNEGISRVADGNIANFTPEQGFPHHVRTILQTDDGSLWLGTLEEGLVHCDRNGNILNHNLQLPSNTIRTSLKGSDGTLWLGTDQGLCRIAGDKVEVYGAEDSLSHEKILCLYEDDRDRIWIGTLKGVSVFEGDSIVPFASNLLGEGRIRSITSDKHGNFWFGTKHGIFKCRVGDYLDSEFNIELVAKENGLSNERIRKLIVDRSNALWVGTYFGGICRLTDQRYQYFTSEHGFPENNVTAIYEASNGHIWLATFDGSVYVYDGEVVDKKYVNPTSQADDHVLDFEEIRKGEIWASTLSGRIERYVDQEYTGGVSSMRPYVVSNLSSFQDQSVVCTLDDGVLLENTRIIESDFCGSVYDATQISDSTMVIACSRGIIVFEDEDRDGMLDQWEQIPGTEQFQIQCMVLDSKNNLWCGTAANGVIRYRNKRFRRYASESYLSSQNILFVELDVNENLWIGSRTGVDFLELTPDQSMILNHEFFGPENGFKGGEINPGAAFTDRAGHLWVGSVRGVVQVNNTLSSSLCAPPALAITSIIVNDSTLALPEESQVLTMASLDEIMEFDYSNNNFTFLYRGIDPSAPEDIIYEHRLLGLSESWSSRTASTQQDYSSLPSGNYAFEVRCRSQRSGWSEIPASFSFKILSPIYMRWWFFVIVALFLAALVFSFFRVRLRYLRREKERLELKVQERTIELQEEKQKSDDLLLNILPQETAFELKENGRAKARSYPMVSVLFSDFKGFTHLSEQIDPNDLVDSLDSCFKAYDRLTVKYGVEKIKTIGDAYMCASGLPLQSKTHAENLVKFALEMVETTKQVNEENKRKGRPTWQIRIGIHSGPVVAGVVGERKFAYDIWGDTVNLAARMESSGEVGKVNISSVTHELISDSFECESRGKIEAKNKGAVEMFFVNGHKKLDT